MIVKKQDLQNAIEKKLGLKPEIGKENNVYIEFEGFERIRVTYPKGRGDIHPKTAAFIRKQMKLGWDDFIDLVKCPLTTTEYYKLLKNRLKHKKI
jgi:hypothetical protein